MQRTSQALGLGHMQVSCQWQVQAACSDLQVHKLACLSTCASLPSLYVFLTGYGLNGQGPGSWHADDMYEENDVVSMISEQEFDSYQQ